MQSLLRELRLGVIMTSFLHHYFPRTLDGYSYERSAITEWFSKGRRTSPVTNLPLTNTLLLPNRALRMVIEQQK